MRSVVAMVVVGALGAAVSVALLMIFPSDRGAIGLGQLRREDFAVVVVVAGLGFVVGVLAAFAAVIFQKLSAPDTRRS